MPSPLTQHTYVAQFLEHLKEEHLGIHKMFNRYVYSEQSTISMGEYSHHYLLPTAVPLSSSSRQKLIAGEAQFSFMTVPQFALERDITPQMLEQQIPAEYLSAKPFSRQARESWHVSKSLAEMVRTMHREMERQAASALLRGKVDFGVAAASIDFNRDKNNALSVSKAWTDSSADVLGDLTGLVRQIRHQGGEPDMCILGESAWDALFANERILKLLDNSRVFIGQIDSRVNALGKVDAAKLNVNGSVITFVVYSAQHEVRNEDGSYSFRKYIDPNAVIMLDSRQDLFTFFGKPPIFDDHRLARMSVDGAVFEAFRESGGAQSYSIGMVSRVLLFPARPNLTTVLMANGAAIK